VRVQCRAKPAKRMQWIGSRTLRLARRCTSISLPRPLPSTIAVTFARPFSSTYEGKGPRIPDDRPSKSDKGISRKDFVEEHAGDQEEDQGEELLFAPENVRYVHEDGAVIYIYFACLGARRFSLVSFCCSTLTDRMPPSVISR
jgi:hypothetical protein